MNHLFRSAAAALAIATAAAAPALAEKSDKVVVDQLRERIAQTRALPGVAQAGTAPLDRAEAALKDLYRALDDNEASEVRSITNEINTLIEAAKVRGQRAVTAAAPPPPPPAPQVVVVERQVPVPAPAPAPVTVFKTGDTLVLQDVVFETGRAELKPGADARLAPMIRHLRDNPSVNVRIAGHTDSQGSDAYNMSLSDRRAEAVRGRLAASGIDPSRITAQGFGESRPVASNANAAGRQANRRVELTLLGEGESVASR